MTDLTRKVFQAETAAVNEHLAGPSALEEARAALQPYALMVGPGFVDRLERFEAAIRANERADTEARRLGAPNDVPTPSAVAAGLVVHGDPIDIGWINGRLDARLRLSVNPGMDPTERVQLLTDLRDTIAALVPVRPTVAR